MKHIGIVAITAEGASLCYRTIVYESTKRLGLNKHPEITLNNPPFDRIFVLQQKRDWNGIADIIVASINKLKTAGADFAIIPANTMHFAFDLIKTHSPLPLLSIVNITVNECKTRKYKTVGILGIGITMSEGLYEKPLTNVGIRSFVPTESDQELVNGVIFDEIVAGKVTGETFTKLLPVVHKLKSQGCEALILGCTELPIVLNDENSPITTIDSTKLLASNAVDFALA